MGNKEFFNGFYDWEVTFENNGSCNSMLAGICKRQPFLRQVEAGNDFKDIKNNVDIIGIFSNGDLIGNLTSGKGLNF